MGLGLDPGTNKVCAARQIDKEISIKIQRDAFIDFTADESTKRTLDLVGAKYLIHGDKALVVGDEALSLCGTLRKPIRRPMFKGVISNKDSLAREVLIEIIKNVAGPAQVKNEPCFYSIPAMPLELSPEEFDVSYHSEIISEALIELGYKPSPINEALCLVYKELGQHKFTGTSISFGAGMTNTCFSNLGIVNKGAEFSLLRGGDWINQQVMNRKVGLSASKIISIKESQKDPIHLIKDNGSKDLIRDAICKFTRALIKNTLQNTFAQFQDAGFDFDGPVPLVVAGGTTLIAGFMEVFKEELGLLDKPFQISDLIHAKNPLTAVATGALMRASI